MEISQTSVHHAVLSSSPALILKHLLRYPCLTLPVLILFTAASTVIAQPIQIGYTNCVAITNYTQNQILQLGQFRWYFAHASVGANIMSGITALHNSSTTRYPITTLSEDGTPPATTKNGIIYEYARGNPSSDEKFSNFATYVTNGWRYPKIHLALNKLCYIDQDADLDTYLQSMLRLESAFPETVFVYMTMPLTTSEDGDNYKCNLFNSGVREWVRTNNLVLFDVADIESHDTSGNPTLFNYNGRICQKLCDTYTTDGGHLNTQGSKLVASGFYALGAALLNTDRDHDGVSDGCELISGTIPTQSNSALKLHPNQTMDGTLTITWPTASNRLYILQRSTNLFFTNGVQTLFSNTPTTPPAQSYTEKPTAPAPLFYRLQVRQ